MNRKELGLGTVSALALGLFLAVPAVSRAANINFNDTSPNDTITVTASDFELGFSVNGQQIEAGLGVGGTTVPEQAGPLSFSGQWIDDGANGPADRTIYLVEASDPTIISDILHYTVTPNPAVGVATISGTFVSDFENNLPPLPAGISPADIFVEDGGQVDFFAAFLTGQVLSDVDPPASTPEPVSVVLTSIALGALGLGTLRRRQG